MSKFDVKGFNEFQDEILVIDTNLNDEIDPNDELIALRVEGLRRGEKVKFDHPKFIELMQRYKSYLTKPRSF